MRYLIWGAGYRGGKVLEVLKRDQVAAFVDTNTLKLGTIYEGKEVCSFEEAQEKYPDCIYIITPLRHEEEIIETLKRKGIDRYIVIGDGEISLIEWDYLEKYTWDIPGDICYIYGVNLINLRLYVFLKKIGTSEVKIVPKKNDSKKIIELLSGEYDFIDIKDMVPYKKVIVISEQDKFKFEKYENVERPVSILNKELPIMNKELIKYKDIHKGKRCFIVATGPSLTVEDLNMLYRHREITMSMNRIYNIFSRTKWRPDYYVVIDSKAIEDLADEIADLQIADKFVADRPQVYWENTKACDSSKKIHLIPEGYKEELPYFSDDIRKGVYDGYTVTYSCLQIAAYMGFEEIYLLGVDFSYLSDVYSDKNHFEGYRSDERPVRLNEVRPDLVELAYKKAKIYGEEHGIKIYNATRGGKLEVFPRISFDKLFGAI